MQLLYSIKFSYERSYYELNILFWKNYPENLIFQILCSLFIVSTQCCCCWNVEQHYKLQFTLLVVAASLCAVADVTMTTRRCDADVALSHTFDSNGNVVDSKPSALPRGMSMSFIALSHPHDVCSICSGQCGCESQPARSCFILITLLYISKHLLYYFPLSG